PSWSAGTLGCMTTTKQRPPRDWREGRRLRALELHEQGWTGKAIAAALGVSKSAVSQWLKRGREGGPEALRAQPPGRAPRLSAEQRAALPGAARPRGRGLRLFGRGLDHEAGGGGDLEGVWGAVPPRSCGAAAPPGGVEFPAADPPGQPKG